MVGYGISRGTSQNRSQEHADNAYLGMEGKKMKWIEISLLAVGAIVGALLRYKLVESPVAVYGLPVNILAINIIGSFILGLFSVLSVGLNFSPQYTLLVAVGFCGSFTTMSSFALESSNLFDSNRFSLLALNILANVGLSLGAIFGGRLLGDVILERLVR
jgi:fluoride exporter